MAVTYAFDFVFANFGIAIAARMPMMTTTISSSISVKPLRFMSLSVREWGGTESRCSDGRAILRQCEVLPQYFSYRSTAERLSQHERFGAGRFCGVFCKGSGRMPAGVSQDRTFAPPVAPERQVDHATSSTISRHSASS